MTRTVPGPLGSGPNSTSVASLQGTGTAKRTWPPDQEKAPGQRKELRGVRFEVQAAKSTLTAAAPLSNTATAQAKRAPLGMLGIAVSPPPRCGCRPRVLSPLRRPAWRKPSAATPWARTDNTHVEEDRSKGRKTLAHQHSSTPPAPPPTDASMLKRACVLVSHGSQGSRTCPRLLSQRGRLGWAHSGSRQKRGARARGVHLLPKLAEPEPVERPVELRRPIGGGLSASSSSWTSGWSSKGP